MGILSLLLITPAIGALILALIPGQDTKQIRLAANIFAALSFLLSCWLVVMYDIHDGALQFEEQFVLNPKLGTAFALGVDGLSLPMVVLATLLT